MKALPFLHVLLQLFVRIFGTNLTDYRTGEKIARAFVFCWGGHIHLIGLQGKDQVIPIFLPQEKLTFWKRRIGFTVHPRPDFPRETSAGGDLKDDGICFLLLSHLPPTETRRLLEKWDSIRSPGAEVLLCYGGSRENFDRIEYSPKIYLDDPRLRTLNHQKEKQSYTQMFQAVSSWLQGRPDLAYVYLAEYDHWPLVKDLGERLIGRLKEERADILGHELFRRDRTSCVYYLHHRSDPRFLSWLQDISCRSDKGAVFNMLGSGSFWTREAFLAVGARSEPFPMYLETYLPTLAHHLGFRLRDLRDQNRFIGAHGDRYAEIEMARREGAWTLHPVKSWPRAE